MKAKLCEICGDPMPDGETMFKYHGYSGPCPKPPLKKTTPAPAWHNAPTCAGLWMCLHDGDFSATVFNAYEVANFVEPAELETCRWYGPIPQDESIDAAIAKAEGREE